MNRKPKEKGPDRSVCSTRTIPTKNIDFTLASYTKISLRKSWSTLGLGEREKDQMAEGSSSVDKEYTDMSLWRQSNM